MVEVRLADISDSEGILNIYSPFVLAHATTFETQVPSIQDIQNRIKQYTEKYPWLICSVDEKIAGYVYASPFKDREAYQWTCESSIYLDDDFRGKGIAIELYAILFRLLRMQGIRSVYAGITLPNDASVRLHEKFHFRKIAEYENVGYKLGLWRNVGWWRLQLNEYCLEPPPPIWFSKLDQNVISTYLQESSRKVGSALTI